MPNKLKNATPKQKSIIPIAFCNDDVAYIDRIVEELDSNRSALIRMAVRQYLKQYEKIA